MSDLTSSQTVPPGSSQIRQTTGPETGSWRERWRQLKLAHCAIPNYGNARQFWNNKKKVHSVYMKGRPWGDPFDAMRLKNMNIPGKSTVLDIGAGPGTFAIPLAKRGCRITVVEPSPVMRDALSKRMKEEHIRTIRVIPKRWEDVTDEELGGPFDVVIASYSLTMMDIGEALARMHACCTGTVHLFWFLTPPAWVRVNRDLWPLLHGGEFPGEPLAGWLWQVLAEMGIYANLRVEQRFPPASYSSVDDAVAEYRQRLNCTTAAQEQIVYNYFQTILRKDGRQVILGDAVMGAHLWWDTRESVLGHD
jgi:SAM-dependent methyltransferase